MYEIFAERKAFEAIFLSREENFPKWKSKMKKKTNFRGGKVEADPPSPHPLLPLPAPLRFPSSGQRSKIFAINVGPAYPREARGRLISVPSAAPLNVAYSARNAISVRNSHNNLLSRIILFPHNELKLKLYRISPTLKITPGPDFANYI